MYNVYIHICTSPTCGEVVQKIELLSMSTITLALSFSLSLSLSLSLFLSRALGHAANRGKVYLLHPELFKVRCLTLT